MPVEDRCPGVLRPHLAADGALIRLRLPGGTIDTRSLLRLSDLARFHGGPDLQLTTRAGLQLRGLPDPLPDVLVEEVTALGLLPSASHERVRTIVASPLSGIDVPGVGRPVVDLRPMVAELDAAILAEPELAGLSGRFLVVLDDGRGDVAGLSFDLGYRAESAGVGVVMIGGTGRGLRVPAGAAVPTLIWLARAFQSVRGDAWHVRDLPSWVSSVSDPLDTAPLAGPPPLGAVGGAAVVQVPLGLLTPAQARAVAVVATSAVVTPWRGLVLPDAADRLAELAEAGLLVSDDAAWSLVSACIGAPGCVRSHGNTRQRARQLVEAGIGRRTHVSGCDRRCGAPVEAYEDVVL